MSKIHPSGAKSTFSALPVAIFAAIALLFRQKFPSAEQKMHLFELEKRNLDILLKQLTNTSDYEIISSTLLKAHGSRHPGNCREYS